MKKMTFAEMKEMQNDLLGFAQKTAVAQGGVAHLKMLWMQLFLVNEPAVIREILVHHSHQMHRDPFVSRVFKRFMGNGVFMAEGEFWKKQRKLMQPAFHATRVREYTHVMADYTRDMVSHWRASEVLAVDQALTQLTLRIIAKTMYDVDIAEETAVIGHNVKEILSVMEAQLKMNFIPPKWLPTRLNRRFNRAYQKITELLRRIIRERQAEGRDHGDLLSMLLSVRDEDDEAMPEQQLLDECLTLFVAGHETTAAALTWSWYLLAQHPDVAAQLYGEIEEVLGGEPITFAKLPSLPLLEAVVKETMRLYPPAFGFGRAVQEAFAVGDYNFPKGAIILFNSFVTHRRPDLYEEPEAFRPERFMDKATEPDRYTYYPFGAGPRICLGNMFAMLEAQVILATMMQQVQLELAVTRPVELDTLVTLRPKEPLLMRVGEQRSDLTAPIKEGVEGETVSYRS
jgi:cytochrome P450